MARNVFSGLLNALKLEVDSEEKYPLHIGVAMACWMYLALMDEASIFLQAGLKPFVVYGPPKEDWVNLCVANPPL
ncbi:hypothetical protein LIT38_16035 [Bacillus sp. CMF12]|uniref:hypothetical protein n=1 Tax=Bacillus sp. CMF12 TaxID=2884834 RepID=UPI002079BA4A|nr:hypothetical protein [Bacillus sp. CMF12]USK52676.1 hypothetical protein LIT38_16035 [Bacillus sp. CMF12]